MILHLKEFKFPSAITNLLLFPNGKGCFPSSKQICIFFNKGCFVLSLVEIGPVVLQKMKCESLPTDRWTDRQTEEGQTSTTDNQKSSLEFSAQVRCIPKFPHFKWMHMHFLKSYSRKEHCSPVVKRVRFSTVMAVTE